MVPGGGGCGWTVLPRESDDDDQQGGGVLARALELAHLRASSRSDAQGPVCGLVRVRVRVRVTDPNPNPNPNPNQVCGGQTVRLCGLQARPEL